MKHSRSIRFAAPVLILVLLLSCVGCTVRADVPPEWLPGAGTAAPETSDPVVIVVTPAVTDSEAPSTETDPIPAATTTEPEPVVDYSGLITDVYSETADYTDLQGRPATAVYRIPRINLEGPDIERINGELYRWYNDIQYSLETIRDYDTAVLAYVDYTWNVHGDLLCLHQQGQYPMDDGFIAHNIYCIMISAGREATREEILSVRGIDNASYEALVEMALATAFLDTNYDYRSPAVTEEMFLGCYRDTVRPENIANAVPFINDEGHLAILGMFMIPDFGWYDRVMDLETFTVSPHYEEVRALAG